MNEQTPQPVTQPVMSPQPVEVKKNSILDETRAAIEDLRREREEISKIRDELAQLRSDQLLSGSAGIRQEVQAKPETNKEYRKRILKEIREGKFNPPRALYDDTE